MEEQSIFLPGSFLYSQRREVVSNVFKLMDSNIYNSPECYNRRDPIDYYCESIKYVNDLYYLKFSNISFTIPSKENNNENFDWKEVKKVLEKVGGIKCNTFTIIADHPKNPIPFTILKYLIGNLVIFCEYMEILGSNISIDYTNKTIYWRNPSQMLSRIVFVICLGGLYHILLIR
ncbi:hypothetical protein NEFER03_0913 [Nematocida sp. LUAm3]|nr:hypothetical protein NEFER03_0913 [Nematocida sp. LUAm3]KAI5174931.1 hypothetical protein NEFER02_1031 [Nematocida sp. LUAm2]KAI5177470.1 hypothetical protein NEFER01_0720 [Nematocida sp. LUAm1]